jgi:hypothetical protein
VINEPPNTKLAQEDILAYISRTAAAASETKHEFLPILPSTLSPLPYSIHQFDLDHCLQNYCNYGKTAYWLHSRDNESYADEWKAFRLCRKSVILRCVKGR